MNDLVSTDSEGVVTFRPATEAKEVNEHQDLNEYETADELSETHSVNSNRSCSPDRTPSHTRENSNDRAIGQMAEMVSGMTSLFKDVVKELRELKQPQRVTSTTEVNRIESNVQANRSIPQKRQLSPNAGIFRPGIYSAENSYTENTYSQPNKQTLRGHRSSSDFADVLVNRARHPQESHRFEPHRLDGPGYRGAYDDLANDELGYHGNQRQSQRLPSNQYPYDPHVNMYDRNDNRSFQPHSDMQDMQFNRGNFQCPRPNNHVYRNARDGSHIKISSFTGKEDWVVWITRFEAIAERMGWDESIKLDQILPRIEGQTAAFVFSQVHPAVLRSYTELKAELNNRFRVIETPRLYASRFSRRSQKVGETAKEFAAELKVLYDKAHGFRDRKTRDEDLVRRFLDGIRDDDIRFEVEYNKEPVTIDDAVFHVVNYIHTRNLRDRRSKENIRWANEASPRSDEWKPEREVNKRYSGETKFPYKRPNNRHGTEVAEEAAGEKQQKILETILDRLQKLENRYTTNKPRRQSRDELECFNCHKLGHFARDCPEKANRQADKNRGTKRTEAEDSREKMSLNYKGPALVAKGRSSRM